ncbi:MAG: hypothetical protein OEV92_08645 [Nitrospinota bacterium]|nr:hypothetical protein [Nitrospinota bacterium]
MNSAQARGGVYFYTGVFMVTMATLALQITQTRILSVVTWYYLAFFTISMAMFGITLGAVWVYFQKDRFAAGAISGALARHSSYFAAAICVSFAVQTTLALTNISNFAGALVWVEMAALLAAPYVFSGIVVSMALTRSVYPVGKVYGADLVGAAAGCLAAFFLLNITTAYSAIFLIGAIAGAGALLFKEHARINQEPEEPDAGFAGALADRPAIVMGLAALAVVMNAFGGVGFEPIVIKEKVPDKGRLIYSGWNSFSNVQLHSLGASVPKMWGPSRHFFSKRRLVVQNYLYIDSDAGTAMYFFDGDLKSIDFLKYDITTLAHNLPRPKNSAAVIGVGGGRDIQSAHLFGFNRVTGVDVNPIFIKLLTEDYLFAKFAGVRDIEGVRLVNDEARSWFRRTDEKFDFIQMSLVDTWAATGAGAFTLSENSLYTLEGWECFLNRLNPEGVFTVSRWFNPGRLYETGRVVSLAVGSLLGGGSKNPKDHIALLDQGLLATIIISKRPFDDEDVKALNSVAELNQYHWVIEPGAPAPEGVLGRILSAKSMEELASATSGLPLDLSPPTDDRPFFFNLIPLNDLPLVLDWVKKSRFSSEGNKGVVSGNARAAMALFSIFLISLLFTILAIIIPLRPAALESGRFLVNGATWYFACIGFGFIIVEMGVLQRFSVFLGHPIYSLTVSLFCLILSAGAGSVLSEKIKLDKPGKVSAWAAFTSGYLVLFGLFGAKILWIFDGASIAAKIAVSTGMISSVGLLLGFGFPTGMRLVSIKDPRPTPWLWGVNGACGVLGSSIAIWLTLAYGISSAFLAGAAFYLAIIPPALMIISAPPAKP